MVRSISRDGTNFFLIAPISCRHCPSMCDGIILIEVSSRFNDFSASLYIVPGHPVSESGRQTSMALRDLRKGTDRMYMPQVQTFTGGTRLSGGQTQRSPLINKGKLSRYIFIPISYSLALDSLRCSFPSLVSRVVAGSGSISTRWIHA